MGLALDLLGDGDGDDDGDDDGDGDNKGCVDSVESDVERGACCKRSGDCGGDNMLLWKLLLLLLVLMLWCACGDDDNNDDDDDDDIVVVVVECTPSFSGDEPLNSSKCVDEGADAEAPKGGSRKASSPGGVGGGCHDSCSGWKRRGVGCCSLVGEMTTDLDFVGDGEREEE